MDQEDKRAEVYAALDDAIIEGFQRVKEIPDSEERLNETKMMNELVATRVKEEQAQCEAYYKGVEADLEAKKTDDASKLSNRVNPNTVIVAGTLTFLTGVELLAEANGWMIKPKVFFGKLINMISWK